MTISQPFANWIFWKELSKRYLMCAFMASQDPLVASSQRFTVGSIYIPAMKEFHLRVLPIEKQKEIVRSVENSFKFADQIEAHFKKAQSYTDKLSQAILAKVFRGELIPKNEHDEPASVLLELIKAEKLDTKTQNKKIKSKDKSKGELQTLCARSLMKNFVCEKASASS